MLLSWIIILAYKIINYICMHLNEKLSQKIECNQIFQYFIKFGVKNKVGIGKIVFINFNKVVFTEIGVLNIALRNI